MKRNLLCLSTVVLLTICLLSVTLCATSCGETGDEAETTASEAADAAPDFTVLDAEGNEVHLLDFRGRPVVLNFWASWCPPCKAEMPDFEAAYQAYGDRVAFVIVNLTDGSRETVASAKAHIADCGYTFPVYFDTAYSAASAYGISSIPRTYFIDAEGRIVSYATQMIDAEALEQGIGRILDGAED